ncbi:hypothetical protein PR002_g11470 [Phytophthora rubi]|uniref:RING-type domain-containing protein n=1 Tax=Phytophthora rubi TaxID=129364 RepID=A0A6A3M1M6_9STRA|nr:hypothetical protein PR002_g11470 [Phytophthora rubi]
MDPDADASGDNSTRCEACKSCGAVLELDGCGHRFHPRCIYAWPATHCEICDEPVSAVLVFRGSRGLSNSGARKGKWSVDEHKYADMMMKQFQVGALPLADGLHLRVFMANMLQCDPLRVTKKYTGQAIGKQNFAFQHRKNYCYNLHVKLQKQLSNSRNHYYWHVQYRCKFSANLNIQDLKAAEAEYWVREFCKFAKKIGQRVEFVAASNSDSVSATSSKVPKTAIAPRTAANSTETESISTPKAVVLPPVSSLIAQVPVIKTENEAPYTIKAAEDSTAPSIKDGLSMILGLSSSMDQSPSPLSSDEWNDPSAFVDMTLADLSQSVSSGAEAPPKACYHESMKKGSWMNEWMKEAELEWSKGAISWSLSLSTEPLADFA